MTINWSAVHTRLFKLIDQPMPLKVSGPDFIKHVQAVKPDFPDYYEYGRLRDAEGKNSTRSVYYRDILLALEEPDRFALVSNLLAGAEKYDPGACADIRKLMSGGVSAPSALIPAHAWNGERLNDYLRDMDAAIASGNYSLSVTLSYTCLEGFLGAFVRAKAPTDKYPTEIIELARLVRDQLSAVLEQWPPEILKNINHAAYAVDKARNKFSDSHFGEEAELALATYIRDIVDTQIRLLLHFM
jgi:hypothetical protein